MSYFVVIQTDHFTPWGITKLGLVLHPPEWTGL